MKRITFKRGHRVHLQKRDASGSVCGRTFVRHPRWQVTYKHAPVDCKECRRHLPGNA